MAPVRDLTNKSFGRLTVVRRTDNYVSPRGKNCLQWVCKCSCGNVIIVLGDNLKQGRTKSCGCWAKEQQKKSATTHGLSNSPLYSVWGGMVDRCNNEKHISYKNYGGRGISVCEEWRNSFEKFYYFCINSGHKEGLELDRKDPDGDYAPNNCRFVTKAQNVYNQRPRCGYKGVTKLKNKNKWRAVITKDYKNFHIGYFSEEKEAAIAYNEAAKRLFGEYAYFNKVGDDDG